MTRPLFCSIVLTLLLSLPSSLLGAEITVSAASSLTNVFKEIAANFTQETGISVHLNFASSNTLLRQIENGAPADIFASADQETMDKAQTSRLVVPERRRNFALNSLVLITPVSQNQILTLADLKSSTVRSIAIGKPESVPAGCYARTSLLHHQLWEQIQPRLIYGNNVRQVLGYIGHGEADAGFVYKTDALTLRDKVRIVLTVEPTEPISYPIAVTTHGAEKIECLKFIDFVFSAKSSAILLKHGFTPKDNN